METCAGQLQLPHCYAQLMVQSRPDFLYCRGPERTHPWDWQTQACKDTAALLYIWPLASDVAFYQPHFFPSSSSPSPIKQLLKSKGWLSRLLL